MNAATEAEPLDALAVTGARVHNLKNINVTIPHGRLTVITGLSGSGKSSLAFDTIFAEGQTPLHRNILELCPPDARHPRASRRGPHHRPFTRHSHRAENHQPQSPLHDRNNNGNIRLPQIAICTRRHCPELHQRQSHGQILRRTDRAVDPQPFRLQKDTAARPSHTQP